MRIVKAVEDDVCLFFLCFDLLGFLFSSLYCNIFVWYVIKESRWKGLRILWQCHLRGLELFQLQLLLL